MSAALSRSFASFAVPNYRIYFGGQLASLAGNWMQIVAELWLVLALTGSAIAVGITTALQFSGVLVLGMVGGALADRFDKRKLLIVTQAALAAPALAMLGLSLAGALEVWTIYVLVALRGLVLAADIPARQAFVIEIVGAEHVVNAVSLNSVLVHLARIAGPALAGLIIALWGTELCFAINAASFGVMIFALSRLEPGTIAPARKGEGKGAVRAGIGYVRRTPELRLPLTLMAILGTLGFNFPVILPLLANDEFGGQVSAYSLLMVGMGVGAIAGALITGARSRVGNRVIAASAAGFATASIYLALVPSLALAMVGMAFLGAASVTFAAAINSGLQLDSAPEMRGRVMSLYSLVFVGTTPIGAPLTGWVAEAYGSRATLLVGAAAAVAVCGVIAWQRFGVLRRLTPAVAVSAEVIPGLARPAPKPRELGIVRALGRPRLPVARRRGGPTLGCDGGTAAGSRTRSRTGRGRGPRVRSRAPTD